MRKIVTGFMLVFCFCSLLILAACAKEEVVKDIEVETEEQENVIFERHNLGGDYSILVEKETGICYLEYNHYKGTSSAVYGITVMLNKDGTPKIWKDNK